MSNTHVVLPWRIGTAGPDMPRAELEAWLHRRYPEAEISIEPGPNDGEWAWVANGVQGNRP